MSNSSIRVLKNAQIYTGNPDTPWAYALAIVNDKVAALDDKALAFASLDDAIVEDLNGATIMPGLTDAHIHLLWYSQSLPEINLRDCSRQGMLDLLAQKVAETPSGKWIRGRGWDQNIWQDKRFPTAEELDQVSPDNPVVLIVKSGHAVVVNSAALHKAGIDATMDDPPFGKIGRDDEGRPDGMLYEDAMNLVLRSIPEYTLDERLDLLDQAQTHLLKYGITGVHCVDGHPAFSTIQEWHNQQRQRIRVVKYIRMEALEGAIAAGLRSGLGDALLRFGGLKLFADGALGPRTGAMLEPYENEADNTGILTLEPERLNQLVISAAHAGIASAVHAIGDHASRIVLNALEQAAEIAPDLRLRVEHVQSIKAEDQPRLAKAGIIASMQPIHCVHDQEMAMRYLGAERCATSYAWRTMLDHGTHLAFGSDAPIEEFDPFAAIYGAVTRRSDLDGAPGPEGWFPEQRLTLIEAIHAYTIGAAYAAKLEEQLGSLEPGKFADVIVLDRDIFSLEPEALLETKVQRVMVAGLWQDL